jgi:hypothetical protein
MMTTAAPKALKAEPVLRVGFAGQRSAEPRACEFMGRAFGIIREAADALAARPTGGAPGETIGLAHATVFAGNRGEQRELAGFKLELLTGFAPGADQAAIEVWRSAALGRVHALFPFADPDEPFEAAWTDRPQTSPPALRTALLGDGRPFDAFTVLDGAAAEMETPPRSAHLDQTRWLVRWSDVLVAAWDGCSAAGPGGTADAVASAMLRGAPVLWLDPAAESGVRLLLPSDFWEDGRIVELIDTLADPASGDLARERLAPPATAASLADALALVLMPPRLPSSGHGAPDEETAGRLDYCGKAPIARSQTGDRFVHALAGGWAWFWRNLGKASAYAAPKEGQRAPAVIQTPFAEADARASLTGDLQRGAQTTLLLIAVAAVFVGTLPVAKPAWKIGLVMVEALLVLGAVTLWNLSYVAANHQRWSDIRRLAERLRCLRATWAFGFDLGDDRTDPPPTWTEWYVRAIRRAAGPPTGVIRAADIRAAATSAREDSGGIVAGQAAYHSLAALRHHRLHAVLSWIERLSIAALAGALIGYIVWHGGGVWLHLWAKPPAEAGGVLLIMSAVLPTVGAACLALDAKIGIEENQRRSLHLAEAFERIRRDMASTASPAGAIELLRDAARLATADVDGWREASVRRKLAAI